jgi:hypothetical protein
MIRINMTANKRVCGQRDASLLISADCGTTSTLDKNAALRINIGGLWDDINRG